MTELADIPCRLSGQDIITWAQAGDVESDIREQSNIELQTESVTEAIVTAVSAQRVEQVRETLGRFLARSLYDTGVTSLRVQIKERDLSNIYRAATGIEAPALASTLL